MKIELVYGDITKSKTDLIVNSLGTFTNEYGEICYNILKKANSKDLVDFINSKGIAKVFDLYLTDSYDLPCKQILHIVTPYRWEDDDKCTNLKHAYDMLIQKALELKVDSITIPFIGTGANGYSRNDVYESATSLIETYYDSKEKLKVLLVAFRKEGKRRRCLDREILERNPHLRNRMESNAICDLSIREFSEIISNGPRSGSGPIVRDPREKRVNKLKDMIRINQIFSECDLDDIEDPGENVYKDSPAYHFFESIQEKNDLSTQQLRARFPSEDMVSYNEMSRFKIQDKKFSKFVLYCLAIAVKMNVTEALCFMVFEGYSFNPEFEEDRVFHSFLENGKLPNTIVDYLDSFEKNKGWEMFVKKKIR